MLLCCKKRGHSAALEPSPSDQVYKAAPDLEFKHRCVFCELVVSFEQHCICPILKQAAKSGGTPRASPTVPKANTGLSQAPTPPAKLPIGSPPATGIHAIPNPTSDRNLASLPKSLQTVIVAQSVPELGRPFSWGENFIRNLVFAKCILVALYPTHRHRIYIGDISKAPDIPPFLE